MSKVDGFDDFTGGQLKALVIKLGGVDVVNSFLRDEIAIEIKEVIKKLFDKNGRRIPQDLEKNVCDPNKNFMLVRPKMNTVVDYANRILRLHGSLGINTEITAEGFMAEINRQLEIIKGDAIISNIANGVYLPVIMPKLETADLGTAIERYLKGVGKSYKKIFSKREFNDYRSGTLAGEVSIISESRHDVLIKRVKQGPVIGIYFPNSLQGFSVYADREQMSALPENFILSGLDTLIAMIMYSDVLAKDYNTPGLDMAALSWRSADAAMNKSVNRLTGQIFKKLFYKRGVCPCWRKQSTSNGEIFLVARQRIIKFMLSAID